MPTATVSRLLLLVLILVLAGCAQIKKDDEPALAPDPDIARAEAMMAAGQYGAAALLYRDLAARSLDPAARAGFLLDAAEAARQSGDWDAVRAALAQLDVMVLDETASLQRRLLRAETLIRDREAAAALTVLEPPPPASMPTALRVRYHGDVADAYREMGNLLETANALQAVDALQTDRGERLRTQTEILRTLTLLNEQVLERLQPSPPGIAGGWMELALLVKRYGDQPAELDPQVAAWRQRFPDHPALPEVLQSYQAFLRDQYQAVASIAVLLPQSGRFAEVADAISDGIMIRRFEWPPAQRPAIRFYDSSDTAGIWPLYNRAVADGAELVIGPLQKAAVDQLIRAGELPVPVLALNQVALDTAPPENLYMYSLSPEDEARQAAEKIWIDGHRRPLVLTPQGEWGDRVTQAFEERWLALGGELAAIGRYDPGTHDHSETITRVLLIDESQARHQEIQRWLGRAVEFEPRRRDDADAIFMAARPVQAQGLRPQLQFHRASDLPIYATSHAWSGQLTPDQVIDMKGIMLADIPWLVDISDDNGDTRRAVAAHLPNSASAYARLYAMGMDALQLAPHLKRLQTSRYESLDGSTGNLFMDELNRVHRQLVWLVLDEPPRLLGYAPRLDLQQAADLPPPDEAPVVSASPAS
jgi:outer membrane PBP1 activator LpoA protein